MIKPNFLNDETHFIATAKPKISQTRKTPPRLIVPGMDEVFLSKKSYLVLNSSEKFFHDGFLADIPAYIESLWTK